LPCTAERPDGRTVGTSGHEVATNLAEARAAMGIDWMDWTHLCQAIPPAYTEHIAGATLPAQRLHAPATGAKDP
jgi:hypothetical protein